MQRLIGLFAVSCIMFFSCSRPSYVVTIDYSQSIKQMMESSKNIHGCGSDLLEDTIFNKPVDKLKGKVSVKLYLRKFYPDENDELSDGHSHALSRNMVIERLDKEELRPANLAELIAFGQKYQDKFLRIRGISELGTTWKEYQGNWLTLDSLKGIVVDTTLPKEAEVSGYLDDYEICGHQDIHGDGTDRNFYGDTYFLATKK